MFALFLPSFTGEIDVREKDPVQKKWQWIERCEVYFSDTKVLIYIVHFSRFVVKVENVEKVSYKFKRIYKILLHFKVELEML